MFQCDVTAGSFGPNEVFTFNKDGSISSLGLCLDAAHDSGNPNLNQLQLWTCVGNANQQRTWDIAASTIQNTGTGYCLDASVHGIASENQLALASCDANILGQRFWPHIMVPTIPGDSQSSPIYSFGTSLLLNAWGGTSKITNGSPVKLYTNGNMTWHAPR